MEPRPCEAAALQPTPGDALRGRQRARRGPMAGSPRPDSSAGSISPRRASSPGRAWLPRWAAGVEQPGARA
eukprot:8066112-Pyramimonas_sp.AAC.1